MSRLSFASPFRPKIQSAKRFLSLQVSQASHVISDELGNILKSKSTSSRKRRRIIEEIFSSEQSYQEHLYLVTTLFLSPVREKHFLPDHVVSQIFLNIEAIQNVNRELLMHMETMGIGDAFLALAPFLKLYSTYANNFEEAMNTVQEWEKKCPKFASFKEQQEALEEANGLKLNALLITPIQRVPRYKMLLENLLWKTPEDHADFEKLKEAVDQISKVAIHINENIRHHENYQKMLSIQNSFAREGAPRILAPGRIFLKEGTLLKVGKRGWGFSKERTFFLFSDILICCKRTSVREKETSRVYVCHHIFPLINCKVHDVMGDGQTSEGGALFSIECQDESLLLFSKSQGEAKSWLNEIRTAIESFSSSKPSGSAVRRSTRLGNNSQKTKRRGLARKVNERRINLSSNTKSSLATIKSPLGCFSPRKREELLTVEEELFDEISPENQHVYERCDATLGDGEAISMETTFRDSDSLSKISCKEGKENTEPRDCENVDVSQDQGNGYRSQNPTEPKEIRDTTGVKRKLGDCEFSDEGSDLRVHKRRSARLGGWLLSCGSNRK